MPTILTEFTYVTPTSVVLVLDTTLGMEMPGPGLRDDIVPGRAHLPRCLSERRGHAFGGPGQGGAARHQGSPRCCRRSGPLSASVLRLRGLSGGRHGAVQVSPCVRCVYEGQLSRRDEVAE